MTRSKGHDEGESGHRRGRLRTWLLAAVAGSSLFLAASFARTQPAGAPGAPAASGSSAVEPSGSPTAPPSGSAPEAPSAAPTAAPTAPPTAAPGAPAIDEAKVAEARRLFDHGNEMRSAGDF